jgi:BirA family biotin operon repressor/biotin-[acetyl-CoA-carboxylase] ligase
MLVSARLAIIPPMRPASFNVLRALADGSHHSAAMLGVSRSELRAALAELRSHGMPVHATRGRGYRLGDRADLIREDLVVADLEKRGGAVKFSLLDECESTSAALLARVAGGAPSGSALACELQTAGRGRRGNEWLSGLANSLTFSLLWQFGRNGKDLGGLSLAAGVACVRALAALDVRGVGLKWPNDLVYERCKLGGILVEVSGERRGPTVVVVGVGINVRHSRAVQDRLGRPITELAAIRPDLPPRSVLLTEMLVQLAKALEDFGVRGFDGFRAEWTRLHALQDERIRVVSPGGAVTEGVAVGVDEGGALLLRTHAGLERLHSGEVSIGAAA